MFYGSLIFIALLVFIQGTLTSHSNYLACGSLNKNMLWKLENGQKLYSEAGSKIIIGTTDQWIGNSV